MPVDSPIKLKVSNRADFLWPVVALHVLTVVAALISPHPVALFAVSVLVFCAARVAGILDFSKSNNEVELTLVIFADGHAHLKSGDVRLEAGVLDARQWYTHLLAVLRIRAGDSGRNLVILPGQQRNVDEYRRLGVWLRHKLCNNARVGFR